MKPEVLKHKGYIIHVPFICLCLLLSACDAMLKMPYEVKNKTSKNISLKIEGYPVYPASFAKRIDTIIVLKPNNSIIVDWANGIGFPWETKKMYREQPGRQNLKLISADSTLVFDSSKKYWKYHHGVSRFSIKKKNIVGK